MPPKPAADANAITIIYLRAFGGEAANASALAPKVGPLGLSAKKISDDIVKATQNYKGLRVTCKLIVQVLVYCIFSIYSVAEPSCTD